MPQLTVLRKTVVHPRYLAKQQKTIHLTSNPHPSYRDKNVIEEKELT